MATRPKTYKKLVVQKLTTDFRAAVKIVTAEMCEPSEGEVCIKTRYVGINASDINLSKGRYFKDDKVPFDIGFEGIGEVVKVGKNVTHLKVGDIIGYMNSKMAGYAEYCCVSADETFTLPEAEPEYLALLVSGLTAAIGLDKCARIVQGETVLISAAAGGTGHIAVQWAKAAECHVVATCSSDKKVKLLQGLGCDRVINYKKENLDEVLSKEYPNGIDVIWETIGGKVFETCLKNIAVKGRLLIIGRVSVYKEENQEKLPQLDLSKLPETLLYRSASVQGFLLFHHQECYSTYYKYLLDLSESRKLRVICDITVGDEYCGLEGIIKGVEYLHSGRSIGKVVVKIS